MTEVISCIPETIYHLKDNSILLECNFVHPIIPIIFLMIRHDDEPDIAKLLAVDLITKNVLFEVQINDLIDQNVFLYGVKMEISDDCKFLAVTFQYHLVVIDLENKKMLFHRIFDNSSVFIKAIWINCSNSDEKNQVICLKNYGNVYFINTKNETIYTFNIPGNFIIHELQYNNLTRNLLIHGTQNSGTQETELYFLLDTKTFTLLENTPLIMYLCENSKFDTKMSVSDECLIILRCYEKTSRLCWTEIGFNLYCFDWCGNLKYHKVLPQKLGLNLHAYLFEKYLILYNYSKKNFNLIEIKTGEIIIEAKEEIFFHSHRFIKIENHQLYLIDQNSNYSTSIKIGKHDFNLSPLELQHEKSKKTLKIEGLGFAPWNSIIVETADLQYNDLNNKLLIINFRNNVLFSIDLPF